MTAVSFLVLALLMGVGTASTVATMEDPDPAVNMLLQALSFSPWGAVMIWIAVGTRKALRVLEEKWDAFLHVVRDWTTALQEVTSAIRELQHKSDPPR